MPSTQATKDLGPRNQCPKTHPNWHRLGRSTKNQAIQTKALPEWQDPGTSQLDLQQAVIWFLFPSAHRASVAVEIGITGPQQLLGLFCVLCHVRLCWWTPLVGVSPLVTNFPTTMTLLAKRSGQFLTTVSSHFTLFLLYVLPVFPYCPKYWQSRPLLSLPSLNLSWTVRRPIAVYASLLPKCSLTVQLCVGTREINLELTKRF